MTSNIELSMKTKLISAIVLGSLFFQPSVTWALPEKEVIKKLDNVPTFTIVDRNGKPVPIKLSTQTNRANNDPALALVFINPQDATNALQSMTQKKPQLKNNLRVFPLSLSEVYEILEQAKQKRTQRPPLVIMPILSEVRAAMALMNASGAKLKNPEQVGVPLFYAAVGKGEDYMIRRDINNNSYIPFYWTKKEVEQDIAAYKRRAPAAQSQQIKIKTISLSQFIEKLLKTNNDAVKIMQIVPSTEQIDKANRLLQ